MSKPHEIGRVGWTVNDYVRHQRATQREHGYRAIGLRLPVPLIEQLDEVKLKYKLRSRDPVIARIIRHAYETTDVRDLVIPPPYPADVVCKGVCVTLSEELRDYLKSIQAHFRGRTVSGSTAFEMLVAAHGTDIAALPVQLELIGKDQAVST